MSNYDRDPTDLEGLKEDKAKKAAESNLARENEDADIRWLMSSKRGRRIVWRLLEIAQPFADPFDTNNSVQSYRVGNQRYGKWMVAKLRSLCPELDLVMIRENKNNVRTDGNGDNSN